MKTKNKIALFLSLVCVVVLTVVSACTVWEDYKKPPQEEHSAPVVDSGEETKDEQNNSEQPDDPADSEPDETETSKPEPKPEPEPEPEPEPKPEPEPEPEPEPKPSVDEPVNVPLSGLNPDPKTAEEIKAVLNDPYMILVNRDHKVSSDYVPSNLVKFSRANYYQLNSTCANALLQLIKAGEKAGYNYTLYSGYRTYSSQYNKYYNKIDYHKGQGKSEEEAIRLTNQYYAPPGASEHHTGLAADVCIPSIVNKYASLHENYDQTAEFRWFSAHAHEYGFILRYRKGDEDITGYNYEPWHYRYVGIEVATEIYNRDITFEEYIEDLESRLAALEN